MMTDILYVLAGFSVGLLVGRVLKARKWTPGEYNSIHRVYSGAKLYRATKENQ